MTPQVPLRDLRVSVAFRSLPYDDEGGIALGNPGDRLAKGGFFRWAEPDPGAPVAYAWVHARYGLKKAKILGAFSPLNKGS
jgi:hypothetical protein